MEAGQLFCGGCYGESYGATCGGCGSKIGGDQLWVEALDQQWHSHCFTCTVSECVLFRCVCSTIDTERDWKRVPRALHFALFRKLRK